MDASGFGRVELWPGLLCFGFGPRQRSRLQGVPDGAGRGGLGTSRSSDRGSDHSPYCDGPARKARFAGAGNVNQPSAQLMNGFGLLLSWLRALKRRARTWRLPVGVVAADRRLLAAERASLGDEVAVLGASLAVRQALPDVRLDIIGTVPFDRTVTVLSDGLGPGSLPVDRWSSLVLVDPPVDLQSRLLEAAAIACRAGGVVLA